MNKPIYFLAYEGMELLDLSGPQSAFYEASQAVSNSYSLKVIGFDKQPVRCEAGLQIMPELALSEVQQCHTLVIPGGKGARSELVTAQQLQVLARLMARCERIVSICTGVYFTARAGLAEGTNVTTHWAFIDDLKTQFPHLCVDSEKLYVQDGRYWSSAGVTSGIDLSLRLIELDLGKTVSHQVAKHLVVYLKRSGNQKQFSDLLNMQKPRTPRMEMVNEWIKEHVHEEISVQDLAQVVHLSERQCHRLFLLETGNTPAQYIEKYRMQLASELLATSDKNIKSIALNLGYHTSHGFNRAFQRNFSVSPTAYRSAFLAR
ncbi:GlxA family transcriptional regulator [Pseudoalteromonas sp. S16_S37]|uniref:GlxA family transcriptional regulator n=1 Tax=Pseudoalteromonas sp. S16_S37 TaxID=2720228 RepID=UPI00168148C0|nr:DJ-1/PfpI family protein [Pseudoalteromonas sp. S16_S37]MBD1584711.1 helix-turn-helix domain-containing protein [Pseudoalteromonas sp. S16_S37]